MMKRREMLAAGGGAVLALSSFRFGWTAPADGKKQSGTSTPEPGSIMLFGTGMLGLAGVLRRKLTR